MPLLEIELSESWSVPPLIVVGPVYVFEPLRTKALAPNFVRLPVPVIAPL